MIHRAQQVPLAPARRRDHWSRLYSSGTGYGQPLAAPITDGENPSMPARPSYLSASILSRCLSRFVLFPSKKSIDAGSAIPRNLSVSGATLSLFVARSPGCDGRQPAIYHLEFSGNGSRAERFTAPTAESWGERAVEVWGLNYPGFGGSTGPVSLESLAESALIAFDALAAHARGLPIVLGCHSIGCAVGLHVAAQRCVAGLILLNPPPLRQLILRHYGPRLLWLGPALLASHIPKQLDSLTNAAQSQAPAIVFSGQSDHIVPARFHQMVFDKYAGPKLTGAIAGCRAQRVSRSRERGRAGRRGVVMVAIVRH